MAKALSSEYRPTALNASVIQPIEETENPDTMVSFLAAQVKSALPNAGAGRNQSVGRIGNPSYQDARATRAS